MQPVVDMDIATSAELAELVRADAEGTPPTNLEDLRSLATAGPSIPHNKLPALFCPPPPPPLGEGHCTLNLSINAIFPILILRTAEVPENYTKPPRGPKKRTSDPVLTQKHSDDA